jgi:DNA polymerase I
MKILLLDGYNMLHRCRFNWGGGKAEGEFQIVYNFMRLLKGTVDDFQADKVYFVVDGKPKTRLDMYPEYKANRREEITDPEEIAYWESFHRQKRICLSLVREHIPVYTAYHKDYEGDDIIYTIAKHRTSLEDEVIIISSDTDFIQAVQELDNVKLFNPIKREYREAPEYNYLSWKAMVGDRSDNIKGVPKIGKVRAERILKNGELNERLEDDNFNSAYSQSFSLIKLIDMKGVSGMELNQAKFNYAELKRSFEEMSFASMLEENYAKSYQETFERL